MKKLFLALLICLIIPFSANAMSVTIEWQASIVNSPRTISYYNVYQSDTSGNYTKAGVVIRRVNYPKTAVLISGLTNKTLYWVVTAVDNLGNESPKSSEITTRWYIVLVGYSKYCPSNQKYWNNK
jgi:fibronectin type 3 domain-containing protein